MEARAEAMTAYRVRMMRLSRGEEDEETIEAMAGAWLEAETAHEIHQLREMYLKVHSNSEE